MPLISRTREAGLRLAIENTVMTLPEELNELFQRLEEFAVDITHVGVCFDMAHANLCSATLNDYVGSLDRLAGTVPIIHLHGHENFGDRDSHLPFSKARPASMQPDSFLCFQGSPPVTMTAP